MFKDDDEMDFEDFKRNLSKDPIGEYEQDELLESTRKNFNEKIRNKEVQLIYNESINEKAPKTIFKLITDFKYVFFDDNTDSKENIMLKVVSNNVMNWKDTIFERMVSEQLKSTNTINCVLIMSLAVANKGKCKDQELQRYLIEIFPKIKQHFGDHGEVSFMAFCAQLTMYEYFVDEMIFKEEVLAELAEIEREPIQDTK